MFFHRSALRRTAAVLCAAILSTSASAAETAGAEFCFSQADFGEEITGICVTAVPDRGAVLLGDRVIRSGDVLAVSQLSGLTFAPAQSEADEAVSMRYLPVRSSGVEKEAELVISIRGRRNDPPAAEDARVETYKNLPIEGLLSVSDPEGDAMTFTLTRSPRRGEVILRDDGSFLYTPKKNKVGTDSFAFTATDGAGQTSPEATITIDILKPADDRQYADTASADCRFEAEWLRNSGLFTGETVNGQFCFSPDEAVSRGQFLALVPKGFLPLCRREKYLCRHPDEAGDPLDDTARCRRCRLSGVWRKTWANAQRIPFADRSAPRPAPLPPPSKSGRNPPFASARPDRRPRE